MRNATKFAVPLLATLACLTHSSFAQDHILSHEQHTNQPEFAQYALMYDGPEILDEFGWTDRVWCRSHEHDLARWKHCMAENLPIGAGPYDEDTGSRNTPITTPPVWSDSSKGSAVLPVEVGTIGGKSYFTTNLAIGEPPQVFRIVFDLTSPGLYVRSASCPYEDCGPQDFSYNGSLSSTHQPSGRRFEFLPDGWVVKGNVSEETLHLVGVKVPNVTFGEVDRYHGSNLYYYVLSYIVDGAVGLAPPSNLTRNYHPYQEPNPLSNIFSTGSSITRKVFTLSIPSQIGEQGSLMIGSYPTGYGPETPRVPLKTSKTPGVSKDWASDIDTWNVPLTSIALNGNISLNVTFPSTYARLDLSQYIGIPAGTVYRFYKALGARPSQNYKGALIDCDNRDGLPDLVLGIGGHDVVLTRDDYSFERKMFGRPFCIVNIVPSDRVATIGSLVMRKLGLVFDVEAGELGCKLDGIRV